MQAAAARPGNPSLREHEPVERREAAVAVEPHPELGSEHRHAVGHLAESPDRPSEPLAPAAEEDGLGGGVRDAERVAVAGDRVPCPVRRRTAVDRQGAGRDPQHPSGAGQSMSLDLRATAAVLDDAGDGVSRRHGHGGTGGERECQDERGDEGGGGPKHVSSWGLVGPGGRRPALATRYD